MVGLGGEKHNNPLCILSCEAKLAGPTWHAWAVGKKVGTCLVVKADEDSRQCAENAMWYACLGISGVSFPVGESELFQSESPGVHAVMCDLGRGFVRAATWNYSKRRRKIAVASPPVVYETIKRNTATTPPPWGYVSPGQDGLSGTRANFRGSKMVNPVREKIVTPLSLSVVGEGKFQTH